jgi:hypothetical protein
LSRSLSKRVRFEVFKRDGFRCAYCGATPNSAMLRVDHVIAVSQGGSDDPGNLVTSCDDCNAGKSNVRLEDRKLTRGVSTFDAVEHTEQIRAYLAAQREVQRARRDVIDAAMLLWEEHFPHDPIPDGIERGLPRALESFALADIGEAFAIVANHYELGRHKYPGTMRQTNRARYFFGILRRWREAATVENI